MNGVCDWFSTRGFGKILGEDGISYYVHSTAILADGYRKLVAGQEVTFDIDDLSPDSRGPKAMNIVPGEIPNQMPKNFRESMIKKGV